MIALCVPGLFPIPLPKSFYRHVWKTGSWELRKIRQYSTDGDLSNKSVREVMKRQLKQNKRNYILKVDTNTQFFLVFSWTMLGRETTKRIRP